MASSEDSPSGFFNCSNPSNKLITASRTRIETIIASSIHRGDGLHENCVSTYTSEHHIKRHEQLDKHDAPPAKIWYRWLWFKKKHSSVVIVVNYSILAIPSDGKSYSVDRGKDRMPFKQSILLGCDQRNDLLADDVRLRVQGAVSDVHAAGAQNIISITIMPSCHQELLKQLPNHEKPLNWHSLLTCCRGDGSDGRVTLEILNGKHVMHHNPGIWNAIWSDMFIESTFMRYGHESGGLTGLTLKPSAVTIWALSLHICLQWKTSKTTRSSQLTRKMPQAG